MIKFTSLHLEHYYIIYSSDKMSTPETLKKSGLDNSNPDGLLVIWF